MLFAAVLGRIGSPVISVIEIRFDCLLDLVVKDRQRIDETFKFTQGRPAGRKPIVKPVEQLAETGLVDEPPNVDGFVVG